MNRSHTSTVATHSGTGVSRHWPLENAGVASPGPTASFPAEPPEVRLPPRRTSLLVPSVLFLATCYSTYLLGKETFASYRLSVPTALGWVHCDDPERGGLLYCVSVMGVLLAHELGHYLQSLRYRIAASLPLFIPMPISPFGTMGAVILQRDNSADRKQMFDIAISGPIAGMLVAIPLCIWGIQHSYIIDVDPANSGPKFGTPLLLDWMSDWIRGPLPETRSLTVNPQLFAGWVGFFITALNLLPIGQLDGGHILHCLLPRQAAKFASALYTFLMTAVIFGGWFYDRRLYSWSLMLFLLWRMGTEHPPTSDDSIPLGWGRTILGWLTLAFIVIGFTPIPFQ
jgi:membrane-associated protease RseP (regulator of RpoE activity)